MRNEDQYTKWGNEWWDSLHRDQLSATFMPSLLGKKFRYRDLTLVKGPTCDFPNFRVIIVTLLNKWPFHTWTNPTIQDSRSWKTSPLCQLEWNKESFFRAHIYSHMYQLNECMRKANLKEAEGVHITLPLPKPIPEHMIFVSYISTVQSTRVVNHIILSFTRFRKDL